MIGKILKHIVLIVPIGILISFLSFALLYFSPGDTAMMLLREKTGNATITVEQAAEFAKSKGLDRTFFEMYTEWFSDVLRGDLGTSYVDGKNINERVGNAFFKTSVMALVALCTYVILGTTIGMYVAVFKGGLVDKVASLWAVLASAIPVFWIALFVIYIFSVKLGVLQTVGSRSNLSLLPPGILMGIVYTGNLIVVVKEKTLLVLKEPFVTHSKAMGLSTYAIIKSHVLKNVLPPIIAMSALAFSSFLGASVLLEGIFSIAGLGRLLENAIGIKDYMIVAASVFILGISVCTSNMIAEIIYKLIDKREEGWRT